MDAMCYWKQLPLLASTKASAITSYYCWGAWRARLTWRFIAVSTYFFTVGAVRVSMLSCRWCCYDRWMRRLWGRATASARNDWSFQCSRQGQRPATAIAKQKKSDRYNFFIHFFEIKSKRNNGCYPLMIDVYIFTDFRSISLLFNYFY